MINWLNLNKKLLIIVLGFFNSSYADLRSDFLANKQYLTPDIAAEDTTILLSEIHSGSTWCRYMIEYLLKKPTMQIHSLDMLGNVPLGILFQDLGVDLNSPKIWKCHNQNYINDVSEAIKKTISPQKDKLIFIIRDYRECMTKIYKNPLNIRAELLNNSCSYFDNIKIFEKWNENNKLLIEYRDLVLDPEKVLYQIAAFFNISTDRIPDFLNNISVHSERSKSVFNKSFGTSESLEGEAKEKSLLFSSKKIPPEFWESLDEEIAKRYPFLWNKYLKNIRN